MLLRQIKQTLPLLKKHQLLIGVAMAYYLVETILKNGVSATQKPAILASIMSISWLALTSLQASITTTAYLNVTTPKYYPKTTVLIGKLLPFGIALVALSTLLTTQLSQNIETLQPGFFALSIGIFFLGFLNEVVLILCVIKTYLQQPASISKFLIQNLRVLASLSLLFFTMNVLSTLAIILVVPIPLIGPSVLTASVQAIFKVWLTLIIIHKLDVTLLGNGFPRSDAGEHPDTSAQ